MVCIYCHSETQVTNSRAQKRLNHIWRRRHCKGCGATFTTLETPDLLKSVSVTTGRHLEPFSRDKLFLSLYDSLKHRKYPVSDATGLTDTVISHLLALVIHGVLDPEDIIKATIPVLTRFDKAAATHYQAFHPWNQ